MNAISGPSTGRPPPDRLPLGRLGAGQRLLHHPPMYFKLGGYHLDAPNLNS
jgi:hypothetical protein